MKRFTMLLMCLFVVFMSANAQRIKRDEIDKFTKKRVIETSFKEISGSAFSVRKNIWIAFKKNGDLEYMRIKWRCDDILAVDEGASIMFLDKDGETYEFANSEYTIAERGAGTVGISGTEQPGLNLYVLGDCSVFEDKLMTDIRIQTTDGYVDFKIMELQSKALAKTYKVFKKALDKYK